MVKMTREQLRAYEILGGKLNETELTDEAADKIIKLLEHHENDTMVYLVDSSEMHRMLAHAYMLDGKRSKNDEHLLRLIAKDIRNMFKHAKPMTLGDMVVMTDALSRMQVDRETDDNLDEQAKENNQ